MQNKIVKTFLIFCFLIVVFTVSAQEMVNINTASLEELETLTGIGPVYAQRIINERPFASLDDLIKVSGIGEKTLQKIKDQGLAYIDKAEVRPRPLTITTKKSTKESYPKNIEFVEIMPSPKGADAENEYIEIKNNNDFEVDLQDWTIKDKEGSTKEYLLKDKIPALCSLTLSRPQTKITLNNSGDGLELLNPNREIIDSVDFGKAKTGIAYIKTSAGWQWEESESSQTKINSQSNSKKQALKTDSQTNIQTEQSKQGIEIDLSSKNKKAETSVFLTAFLTAFLLSAIFIIFKKKLFSDNYLTS